MQNQNTSGTAAAGSNRGGFYFKKVAKEAGLRIGFVTFCWFVFQWALSM